MAIAAGAAPHPLALFAHGSCCCWWLVSLKVLLLVLLGVGASRAGHPPGAAKRLTYLVILLGLAVAFGVEVIYVRDFLDNSDWERMNTVFKFYYQVWTLLSLGGILALTRSGLSAS